MARLLASPLSKRKPELSADALAEAVEVIMSSRKPSLADARADGWATPKDFVDRLPGRAKMSVDALRKLLASSKAFDSMLVTSGNATHRVYRLKRK